MEPQLEPTRAEFFLGTSMPIWLERTDVPLFLSRRRLAGRKRLPRARGAWALDSGAFSELDLHGQWTIDTRTYIDEVRRYADEIGSLRFAASMDLMCEPEILGRTGRTLGDHQRETVYRYCAIEDAAPELPISPILQGYERDDYHRHLETYDSCGVDLWRKPLVGVGSVCRRQATSGAERLISELAALGLRLHCFGFKIAGLSRVGHLLASADSMAWSLAARFKVPPPECAAHHRRCTSCLRFALAWRSRVETILDTVDGAPRQTALLTPPHGRAHQPFWRFRWPGLPPRAPSSTPCRLATPCYEPASVVTSDTRAGSDDTPRR